MYVSFLPFQLEKVKMYHDIPYLLPKSYTKLANEKPAVLEDYNVVDCQVSRILLSFSIFKKSSSFPINA